MEQMKNKLEISWINLIHKAIARPDSYQYTGYIGARFSSNRVHKYQISLFYKNVMIASYVDGELYVKPLYDCYNNIDIKRTGAFDRTYCCGINALKEVTVPMNIELGLEKEQNA
jgi:hypothetical protein